MTDKPDEAAPPQTGRDLAREVLDKILRKPANRKKIREALQDRLDTDPIQFFHTYVLGEQKRSTAAEPKPPVEGADLARQVDEMSGGGAEPEPKGE